MHPKIPNQTEGASSDTQRQLQFDTEEAAKKGYAAVSAKLLDINRWFDIAGHTKSHFYIYSNNGQTKTGQPCEGDYIRISVNGPGNEAGNGDDWVQITEIKSVESDHEQILSIAVRPCEAPVNDCSEVAHFYDADATNLFCVRRSGTTLIVEIHGRNEHVNEESHSILNKLRNIFFAVGGMLGGSKSQWEALADGLIKPVK